ncbi:MAG TPA: SsrA-binding protein SmpB [Candidatus Hydrogenedentes bacterium]|nr:SsrA-binding protein SmpB [Candidatus Hydrogenedentota bacterium]
MADGLKIVTKNRHAWHDYFVLEKLEAGIALAGTEVKSVRMKGAISLKESYVDFEKGEAWLVGARISPYEQGNINNHPPERRRKLLLHKREINKLQRRVEEKGLTVVPLSVYFKQGKLKIEIGLCRGKHFFDKRATIRERETDREIRRLLKRQK